MGGNFTRKGPSKDEDRTGWWVPRYPIAINDGCALCDSYLILIDDVPVVSRANDVSSVTGLNWPPFQWAEEKRWPYTAMRAPLINLN